MKAKKWLKQTKLVWPSILKGNCLSFKRYLFLLNEAFCLPLKKIFLSASKSNFFRLQKAWRNMKWNFFKVN